VPVNFVDLLRCGLERTKLCLALVWQRLLERLLLLFFKGSFKPYGPGIEPSTPSFVASVTREDVLRSHSIPNYAISARRLAQG